MYFTEPEAALNDRRIECARGKVIGGSSSINAMAYVRGNPGDYDRWERAGCAGAGRPEYGRGPHLPSRPGRCPSW